MDHLTDIWTEHHASATVKDKDVEIKDADTPLPQWKDPKLARILDDMVGVGDPPLLSHVTVGMLEDAILGISLPFGHYRHFVRSFALSFPRLFFCFRMRNVSRIIKIVVILITTPHFILKPQVILSFRAHPELRAAVDAREAAGVKSVTAANRRRKNISPEARAEV